MGKRALNKAERVAFIIKDKPCLDIRKVMIRAAYYTKEESEKDNRQRHVRRLRKSPEDQQNASHPPSEPPSPPTISPSPPTAPSNPALGSNQADSTNTDTREPYRILIFCFENLFI